MLYFNICTMHSHFKNVYIYIKKYILKTQFINEKSNGMISNILINFCNRKG